MLCSNNDGSSDVRRIVDSEERRCIIGLSIVLPDCFWLKLLLGKVYLEESDDGSVSSEKDGNLFYCNR